MAEYWGARVEYSRAAMHEADYTSSYYQSEVELEPTERDGGDNPAGIEQIYEQVMNQHPEQISLLADRWQNAYDLLESVRGQLLLQSTILAEEHWRSAEARELFMEKGPGKTLAYLDAWMEAAQQNVEGLRLLVGIAHEYRDEMQDLWDEYKEAVASAENLSWYEEQRSGLLGGVEMSRGRFGLPSISWDSSGAREAEAQRQVGDVMEEYSERARELAWRLGNEYTGSLGLIGNGQGPAFQPMNVVLNQPHPPLPGVPSVPGMPPVVPNVSVPPPPVLPPRLPAPPAVTLPGNPGGLAAPAVTPPAAPAGPPVVAPAPGVAVPPVPPPVPGAAPPAVPAAPAPPAVPRAGVARSAFSPPAPRGSGAGDLAARPTTPPGVIRGSGTAGIPPPNAPPAPGRTIGRKPPGAAGPDEGRPVTGAPATPESPFAGPPTGAVPPVLKNQHAGPPQRGKGRPRPPEGRDPVHPRGPWHPPSAVPPVVARPAAPPPPPEPRRRPARKRPDPLAPRWEAAAPTVGPVINAPEPPSRHPKVSKVDAVPPGLRGKSTAKGVPQEIAARRTVPEGAAPRSADPADVERIVVDEEAFTVETPGGGVVTRKPEDTSPRAEPPTAL